MNNDYERHPYPLSHLNESVLYAFVQGRLKGAAAAAVTDHLERCLACRVWSTRLRDACVSDADDSIISRLVDTSPAVPEALHRALLNNPSSAAPAIGDLWRVGRREALLVWVRRIFDDSAAVIPVTFDGDLADNFSLIIPDDESPLGLELVVMASVEAHVDLRAFLQRVSALPVEDRVEALRESRRSRLPTSLDLLVGAPIVSEQDQRLEYRQVLSDLLADLSPAAFAEEMEVEPGDEGVDVHRFVENLSELTWRRTGLTVQPLTVDHVAIDPAHDLLVVAMVKDLDAAVLVAALTGADPANTLTQPDLARGCGELLRRHPDADAVAVAIQDREWTTVVVDPPSAARALEAPSGHFSEPRVAGQPLPLIDALLKHLDARATHWDQVGVQHFDREPLDLVELGAISAAAAIERTIAEGRRILTPAKKRAYTSLGERDAARIVELITAVAARGIAPSEAVDSFLSEADQ
jgi:hypothetical protein